jgi:quercetin dioxygenase-like cupin family protein
MVHVLSQLVATMSTWADVQTEDVYPGIMRQVVNGERQTMVRYCYAPGSEFPVHSHPQEQITVVISGTIAFTIAGQEQVLHAGQVAVIPGGVEHGARVIGDELVETFNALSPRRERSPGPDRTGAAASE